jgi:hypothetical protein
MQTGQLYSFIQRQWKNLKGWKIWTRMDWLQGELEGTKRSERFHSLSGRFGNHDSLFGKAKTSPNHSSFHLSPVHRLFLSTTQNLFNLIKTPTMSLKKITDRRLGLRESRQASSVVRRAYSILSLLIIPYNCGSPSGRVTYGSGGGVGPTSPLLSSCCCPLTLCSLFSLLGCSIREVERQARFAPPQRKRSRLQLDPKSQTGDCHCTSHSHHLNTWPTTVKRSLPSPNGVSCPPEQWVPKPALPAPTLT